MPAKHRTDASGFGSVSGKLSKPGFSSELSLSVPLVVRNVWTPFYEQGQSSRWDILWDLQIPRIATVDLPRVNLGIAPIARGLSIAMGTQESAATVAFWFGIAFGNFLFQRLPCRFGMDGFSEEALHHSRRLHRVLLEFSFLRIFLIDFTGLVVA